MKTLSWNVNGLGSLAKRAQVKEMVNRCKPSLVCLQETKLEVIDKVTVQSIGLTGQWSFSFVGSIGLSGGILVAWEESYWNVVEEWKGRFSLSVVLERVEDSVRVVFSGVYGPSQRVEKRLLWGELDGIRARWSHPWCLGGDFNEIRFACERVACTRSNRNMVLFADFISKHELINLPLSGARFTWNRGESHRRIDRFLVCPLWMCLTPEVIQKSLVHSVSDHCPILLDPRLESWGPPPFRFEIAWLQDPNMEERMGKWWASENFEGPADVRIGRKLRFVKKMLKEWIKEKRGSDSCRKNWLESRIVDLGVLEEEGLGNIVSREELGCFREEHKSILLHEEISWRQKSRVKWLKEGDKNTAYFHAMASARRRGNRIVSLMVDGAVVSGKEDISSAILSFYNALYTSNGILKPIPEGVDFNHLECDQSLSLWVEIRLPGRMAFVWHFSNLVGNMSRVT
ncbi:uncharacterized protein LOC143869909 [Tasmannia lanceolata]|uniref:uncharacterized protein LOC143869909 n=1 Tax=Tasmannia lanceolata TaxID=3420 RepID=UPI004062E360